MLYCDATASGQLTFSRWTSTGATPAATARCWFAGHRCTRFDSDTRPAFTLPAWALARTSAGGERSNASVTHVLGISWLRISVSLEACMRMAVRLSIGMRYAGG